MVGSHENSLNLLTNDLSQLDTRQYQLPCFIIHDKIPETGYKNNNKTRTLGYGGVLILCNCIGITISNI